MSKRGRWFILLSSITALMLFLSACSNDNNEDTSSDHSNMEDHGSSENKDDATSDHSNMDDHSSSENKDDGKGQDFSNEPSEFNNNTVENLITQNTKNITELPERESPLLQVWDDSVLMTSLKLFQKKVGDMEGINIF